MEITISQLLDLFMESPLVSWVKTFGPCGNETDSKLATYMDLVDGVFLNKIMLQIDPRPSNQRINKHVNNDINLRIQNLAILVRHIKTYYQEVLQQLIMMTLPNILLIGKDPLSGRSMEELKKILLLMLGCAVQCDRKEEYIEKIKQLDIETQEGIVSHIQEVTHNQENVFDLQWLDLPDMAPEELDSLSRNMALHLKRLLDERDDYKEVIVDLTQERDYLQSLNPLTPVKSSSPDGSSNVVNHYSMEDKQHLAVELADSKAKLRRLRQELEEKSEILLDTKHEVERLGLEIQRLKQENTQLAAEARTARTYRDELDSLKEAASKVDRLESELIRCREKLHDVEFYKARMDELREDNLILIETKTLLEEQLETARARTDKVHELEKDNLQLKSKIHDLELDRFSDKNRIEELLEENMVLEIAHKQSMNESAQLGWELDQVSKSSDLSDARKSFVFEMNESASSRILKLEKDNQSLQQIIQDLREASINLEESSLKSQELEKENQQLKKKIENLHSQIEKEKQSSADLESLGEDLLKEKEKLSRILDNVKSEKEKQIKELEQENKHLSQAMAALRQRAQESTDLRVKDVEMENKMLHETITDTSSKLNEMEHEKKQLQKAYNQVKDKVEKVEEMEKEVRRLEKQNEMLTKKMSSVKIIEEKVEILEKENGKLESENRIFKKSLDTLQNLSIRLEVLENENKQLDEENVELRRAVETMRFSCAKITQIERENNDLQKEKEDLQKNVEMLKALGKKSERLEVSYQGLSEENWKLQQMVKAGNKKVTELEAELKDIEKENKELQKTLEEMKISSKRLERLEQEKIIMDQEMMQLEKDKKMLEKESKRFWQQVELKDAILDDNTVKLADLEKENKTLEKEVSKLRELSSRTRELEKENKDLVQQLTVDKRTLATLREDLVLEKLKTQQTSSDLDKLSLELEKIGLNKELMLQDENSNAEKKYRVLENKIESTLKTTLAVKESKIQTLEGQVDEVRNLNQQLQNELNVLKQNLETQNENAVQNSRSRNGRTIHNTETLENGQPESTRELWKVKDRVIELERDNAALQAEKKLMKEQLRHLETQNHSLNNQWAALQKQITFLQENNTTLQTQTANLQVESSAAASQSVSLKSQISQLQNQLSTLEGENEKVVRQREGAKASHDALLRDHDHLVSLYERQSAEYEGLIGQHSCLKTQHKSLEQTYRSLEDSYNNLLRYKAELEEQDKALNCENKELQQEKKKNLLAASENEKLQEELERLKFLHGELQEEYNTLHKHTKDTKSSLNNAQMELTRWQAKFDELKEQHQNMDISLAKLDNRCELMSRLKRNLEEENHHLLSQIQMLNQQNQMLLESSMESKEHYYEEQKQYIDKLNDLRRQKEKLEEKIMDQYKFYDPAPKKKNHWSGARALAKLIKPRKESSRERPKSVGDVTNQTQTVENLEMAASPSCTRPLRVQPENIDNCSLASDEKDAAKSFTSKVLVDVGPKQNRMSYHGGSGEEMEGSERTSRSRRIEPGSRAFSTTAIHLSPAGSPGSQQPGRPKGYKSDDNLYEQLPDHEPGPGGLRVPWPNSLENSRNSSTSSSPQTSKGSSGFPLGRPESMSSDDFVPTKEAATLPRDSYISRPSSTLLSSSTKLEVTSNQNSPVSYNNNLERRPPSRTLPRPRSGSPGSEMVTLEEFLDESNKKSPPTRRHSIIDSELITLQEFLLEADSLHPSIPSPSPTLQLKERSEPSSGTSSPSLENCAWRQRAEQANRRATSLYIPRDASSGRDDLLGDYFKKASESSDFAGPSVQASYKDFQSTPPNYGNLSGDAELKPGRPGQYVKPNLRPMDPVTNQVASLRRPQIQQPISTSKQVPEPQHPGSLAARGSSLSRTFSLATADLLNANAPDLNRMEKAELETPMLKDFSSHILRTSTPTGSPRDRPQSARMSNPPKSDDLRTRSLDTRRLSMAVSRVDKTLQQALSTSSLQPPCTTAQLSGRGRPNSRYGEVAMVSPVRPISSIPEVESQIGVVNPKPPGMSSDCHPPPTAADDPNKTSTKSTPASPDPTADPQTVWYEYGCV
ncbi:protein Daple isoform X1 [Bufo bufo]|uniref:protein Daple isoform X1 n=1 Tax=Bufo bufo TaxID=8384 RepID=UPI001ABE91C7|nr:protein Daple isoform X1 [Bufo bufo]